MLKTSIEICLIDVFQKSNRIFQKNRLMSSKRQCTSIVTFNGFTLRDSQLHTRLFACIVY